MSPVCMEVKLKSEQFNLDRTSDSYHWFSRESMKFGQSKKDIPGNYLFYFYILLSICNGVSKCRQTVKI